jgi:hypothetical protein
VPAPAPAPSSSSSQQPSSGVLPPLPPASASATSSEERGARSSKKSGQWKHKHSVIEMVNELIEELEGIEQQIAQQAVEHIHANEVRRVLATGPPHQTQLAECIHMAPLNRHPPIWWSCYCQVLVGGSGSPATVKCL